MSASEKLRVLEREAFPIPRRFTDNERVAQRALSAALPQIIAVVEEAENDPLKARSVKRALATLEELL